MNELMIKQYKESNYTVLFDRASGVFLRLGQKDTTPFYNSNTPELLDISITNYCERGCYFCYRSSNKNGNHMDLIEYTRLIKEAQQIGVLQIALGGGNPNQHPDFIDILKVTRNHSIIPSYTTNGQGMTDEIYKATKEYCGALAVSWYPPYIDAINVIDKCNENNIKINIHFMLNQNTIKDAILLLHNKSILQKVNAVIFLNYKPIHSSSNLCLKDDAILDEFFNMIKEAKYCKIGFDSCMISFLTKLIGSLKVETIDFCEAARFSAFISENSIMYPCSFMCDTNLQGVDLRNTSIQKAWKNGDIFKLTRRSLEYPNLQKYPIAQCKYCEKYDLCHGGCQFFDINMCR